MSWQDRLDDIADKRARALEMGGPEAVARQHDKGRLAIRERIDKVIDANSFREHGKGAGAAERDDDGRLSDFTPANFVLGMGRVDGRTVVIGGEDFTVRGGSPNPAGLRKSVYAEALAVHYRVPLIRLHEGGGGSVTGAGGGKPMQGQSPAPQGEPVFSQPRFRSVAEALATVPVASAAVGPVAGLPASRLVASHFSVMTRHTSVVLVAGPAVVARALNTEMTKEELGGAEVHGRNGVIDNIAEDEADAFAQIRRFLSYLPNNVWELAPRVDAGDGRDRRDEALADIVPRDRRKPYAMRKLIGHIVDADSFFEMGALFGRGLIAGLARLNGHSVGIFANDTRFYAGAMDALGAQKVRRFIEFCQTFHLPIITFIDEPGFMIGPKAEQAATIRYGTSAVLAAASATVPWASVLVRKNYGVASAAHYAPDGYLLVWPSAEMGALPIEGGVAVAFGREIAAADDPEARRRELEEMLARRLSPASRAESFAMHELIDPRETRPALCDWLDWSVPLLEHQKGPVSFPYRP